MPKLSKKIHKNELVLEYPFKSKEEFFSTVCTANNISSWSTISTTYPSKNNSFYIDFTDKDLNLSETFFKRKTWQLTTWGGIVLSRTYMYYDIEHRSDSNSIITGKILIGIDRVINGPWHIYNNYIRIWDQDKHFEIQLFDCDIARFVDFNISK
jgi:predicted secreted protein